MKKMTIKRPDIGDEIYYGGDMANYDGFFKIVEYIPSERFQDQWEMVEQLADGDTDEPRTITITTSHLSPEYLGHGGTRFVYKSEYLRYREKQLSRY